MKKLFITGALIVSICVSAFAGYYASNQKTIQERNRAQQTLISFAISNIEEMQNGYDADTMEALISNVYAALQFTDDGDLFAALHDLWNALIFDGENIVGKEDVLIKALKSADPSMIKEIVYSIRAED